MWLQAGRPASGTLQQIKSSYRLKYRAAIRDAYCVFERAHDNEISRHWLNKKPTEFWKAWHTKFGKKINANITLLGCRTGQDVAERFASQFKATYYTSHDDSDTVNEFFCMSQKYIVEDSKIADGYKICNEISVELIDKCTVFLFGLFGYLVFVYLCTVFCVFRVFLPIWRINVLII